MHCDMLVRLYKFVLSFGEIIGQTFVLFFERIRSKFGEKAQQWSGYSHFRKLPDLTIEVNYFAEFNKQFYSFIKPILLKLFTCYKVERQ